MGKTEGKEPDRVPALATSLREVIVKGEQFRNVRARELHLGPSDVLALDHLHAAGAMAPKDLSSLMGVTSGTMTALLDRVEKAGFLKREKNPDDRRGLLLRLTPAGRHAMQWLYEQFDEAIRETLRGVPEISPDELQRVLGLLNDSLDREPGTKGPGEGH